MIGPFRSLYLVRTGKHYGLYYAIKMDIKHLADFIVYIIDHGYSHSYYIIIIIALRNEKSCEYDIIVSVEFDLYGTLKDGV